jgi:cold shock CspA family protein
MKGFGFIMPSDGTEDVFVHQVRLARSEIGIISIDPDNQENFYCTNIRACIADIRKSAIQAQGFRSLADGEEVEYMVELDAQGRKRAVRVTGPGGKEVQGAPFRPSNDYDSYN